MKCVAPTCPATASVGAVFCEPHLKAPPGQRGGWLSAHKRAAIRANSVDESIDASNIARRLWVGGKPPLDRHLPEFDMLVLCAKEIQPAVVAFRGTLLRCPISDADLEPAELRRVLVAGRNVADALAKRRTVLVTCAKGINRSALVASLALGLVTYYSADELVAIMRKRRNPDCLYNPAFRGILHRYIGPGRRPRSSVERK